MNNTGAFSPLKSLPVLEHAPDKHISWSDLGNEPFRLFFPLATLAGLAAVLLWPLHLMGWTETYPGQAHARMMCYGFFGGFIFGFLGTAMPRMLSAPKLGPRNVSLLALLFLAMNIAYLSGSLLWGDLLMALLLAFFFSLIALRVRHRKDLPPPGFVLVGFSFLCVAAGAAIGLAQQFNPELDTQWVTLQRLLSYQGFVLMPILGIGPFILPRFFGMTSTHDLPESLTPSKTWLKKAGLALSAGLLIMISFVLEAKGLVRTGNGLRFAAASAFLALEFPFRKAPGGHTILGFCLRLALILLLAGFLTSALYPGHRTALLHITFGGGFALITFIVATRVVLGHSGNLPLLKGRNLWLLIAAGCMLLGLATRMSGDFWPHVMASHYIYGAILWIAGVIIWAWRVLPKVLQADEE